MKLINLIFVIIAAFIKITSQQKPRRGRKNDMNTKTKQTKNEENIIPDINNNIQKEKNNNLQTKKENDQKKNKIELNDINIIEKKNDTINKTQIKNESLSNNIQLKNESLKLNNTQIKNESIYNSLSKNESLNNNSLIKNDTLNNNSLIKNDTLNINNTQLKNDILILNNSHTKNDTLSINVTKKIDDLLLGNNQLKNASKNINEEKDREIKKKETNNIKINQENQSQTHIFTKKKENKNMTNLENNLTDNKLINTKLNEELKENNTFNFSKREFKINEKTIEKPFINRYNNVTILNNSKFNESFKNLTENEGINLTKKFSKNDLINNQSKIYIEKNEQKVKTNFNIDKTQNLTQKTLINNTEASNHTLNKYQINNKTHLENQKEDIKLNKEIYNFNQKKEEKINTNENINYPHSFIGKYTYFIQKDINKFIPSPVDNLIIMFFGYIFMTLIITFINSFQKDNDNKSNINEEKILHAIRQIKIKGNNNNISKNEINTIQNFDINEKNLKDFINLKEQLNELLDTTQKRNNKLSNENLARQNICDLQTRIMLKINNN